MFVTRYRKTIVSSEIKFNMRHSSSMSRQCIQALPMETTTKCLLHECVSKKKIVYLVSIKMKMKIDR